MSLVSHNCSYLDLVCSAAVDRSGTPQQLKSGQPWWVVVPVVEPWITLASLPPWMLCSWAHRAMNRIARERSWLSTNLIILFTRLLNSQQLKCPFGKHLYITQVHSFLSWFGNIHTLPPHIFLINYLMMLFSSSWPSSKSIDNSPRMTSPFLLPNNMYFVRWHVWQKMAL